jgi:chemotaxis signal transduction protein
MKDRPSIRWEEVKQRLLSSQRALSSALTDDPARVAATLRQRALDLAKRQAKVAGAPPRDVLAFALGVERYAIEITDIAEVAALGACTPLPGAAPELCGVINLRGEIRPVFDLARMLALPPSDRLDHGFVLLFRRHGREVGLRVDRALGVRSVTPAELSGGGVSASSSCEGICADGLILLRSDAIRSHRVFDGGSKPGT